MLTSFAFSKPVGKYILSYTLKKKKKALWGARVVLNFVN